MDWGGSLHPRLLVRFSMKRSVRIFRSDLFWFMVGWKVMRDTVWEGSDAFPKQGSLISICSEEWMSEALISRLIVKGLQPEQVSSLYNMSQNRKHIITCTFAKLAWVLSFRLCNCWQNITYFLLTIGCYMNVGNWRVYFYRKMSVLATGSFQHVEFV